MLRRAWGAGNPADPQALGSVLMKLTPDEEGRRILKKLISYPVLGGSAAQGPAGFQKQQALDEVAASSIMLPAITSIYEECDAFTSGEASSHPSSRKKITRELKFLQSIQDAFPPQEYGFESAELGGFEFSRAIKAAEFTLNLRKPPHAGFLTGFRANSRISTLLRNAGAMEEKIQLAERYLVYCVDKEESREKKAEAIARMAYISKSAKYKSILHPFACEMAWKAAIGLASEQGNTFRILAQAKLRSFCLAEGGDVGSVADEFRGLSDKLAETGKTIDEMLQVSSILEKQMAASPEPGERPQTPEESILFEPTKWAGRMEAGERINTSGIDFGFFAGKPAHQLANAALVIANSNATTEESKIARGIIATKVLLSIGEDSLYVQKNGKKALMLHKSQENLLAKIRMVLEKPEVKGKVIEQAIQLKADSRNSGIAERLLGFYGSAEETQQGLDGQEAAQDEAEPTPADASAPRHAAPPTEAPTPAPKAQEGAPVSPTAAYIQENSHLLPHLRILALSAHPYQTRLESFQKLVSSISTGEKRASPQDAVLAIAAFALSENPETAATATSALLSVKYISGHGWGTFDSPLAISNIVEVPQEISNPPIAEKLMHGSDVEAETTVLALAQRAGKTGNIKDGLGRVLPTRVLAAREIIDSFEPSLAATTILKLATRHFPETLLLESLSDLQFIHPDSVKSAVFQAIEANRARREGALFTPQENATEYASTFESRLSEQYLFALGGSLENRNESIAKGALLLGGPDTYRFFIQKLADAATPEEMQIWADALKALPGTRINTTIMEQYDALPPASRPFALEILVSKKISITKAEFLFEICNSGEEKTAAIAASALAKTNFRGRNAERKFELLFRMRNGRNQEVSGHAAELLPEFLRENQDAFTKDSLDNLLNLFIDESSQEISEEARKILLSRPHQLLSQMGVDEGLEERIDAIHSGDDTVATLATFALAKEMAADSGAEISPLDSRISDAVKWFTQEGNQLAQLRFALAAYTARNPHYIDSVLIPLLGSEEDVSSIVAESLVRLGQPGLEAAERAAGRQRLPPRISREIAQRISNKAMGLLFNEGEYSRLAPLLGHSDNGVRITAYSFFKSTKPGKERDEALLKALESDSPHLKIAALSLLPRENRYLKLALHAVSEPSEEVSSLAADFAASLMSPKKMLGFLADESHPEFAKQKIADAYCEQSPGFSKDLADALDAGEKTSPELRKKAILAIRFFQDMDSLYALYRIASRPSTGEQELASDSLVYFCEALSGSVVERGPLTRERMFMLLEAYALSEDGRIRETAKSIARSVDSCVLLEAALCSKDPELLFSTTNLFLSVSNEEYAAKAAIAFREISREGMHSFAEPFQEILFGRNYGAFTSLASPVENPSADPFPYRLVKEVAIQEFINGKGAPGADSLLLEFVDQFGDLEGVFDHGLVSISEFAWAARNESSPRQISARLSSMAPAGAEDKARLLLRVLLENDYTALPEIQKDEELSELVCEHALRRLVESFSGSSSPDANLSNIERGMRLAAELLEQGTLPETPVQGLRHPSSPVVASLTGGAGITEQDFLFGIRLLEEMRADIRDLSILRKHRQAARTDEGVSPAQAMADATRLERARVVQPVRPAKAPSPRKLPRGSGSGQ